jgi:hypothetical protein
MRRRNCRHQPARQKPARSRAAREVLPVAPYGPVAMHAQSMCYRPAQLSSRARGVDDPAVKAAIKRDNLRRADRSYRQRLSIELGQLKVLLTVCECCRGHRACIPSILHSHSRAI